MYHSLGAVGEFIIVGCMLIAHIHEGLYLYFYKVILFMCPIVELSYTAVCAKIRVVK